MNATFFLRFSPAFYADTFKLIHRTAQIQYVAMGEKGQLGTMFSLNCNRINIGRINTTEALKGRKDRYYSERHKSFVAGAAPNYKLNLLRSATTQIQR